LDTKIADAEGMFRARFFILALRAPFRVHIVYYAFFRDARNRGIACRWYCSDVFPKYRRIRLKRTLRERRNAFHGDVIIVTARPCRRSCQFVVGVEYCILLIANVTRRLLLNVTHQRAPITIYRAQFLSQIKCMSLAVRRLGSTQIYVSFNSEFKIISMLYTMIR